MHRSAVGMLVAACVLALPAVAKADFPHVVTRGETLASVARTDGLSVSDLAAANGLSTDAELTTGMILEIPPKGVHETAPTGTAPTTPTSSAEPTSTAGGSYVVQRGDTLGKIAARAGTTVDELAALNGIHHPNLVYVGMTLTLPGGSTASTEPTTSPSEPTTSSPASTAGGSYVVERGDTLGKIAARAGTTVDELAQLNGIRDPNLVYVGMTLTLPGGASTGGSSTESTSSSTGASQLASETTGGRYIVQPGDTLASIAARAGTTTQELAALNGISNENLVFAGMTLALPGGSGATSTSTGTTSTGTGSSSAADVPTTVGSGGPPFPTDETVTGPEIAAIAAAEGVPPALAEAIAWQESGFNNSLVSSVGAVGVMQIVPNTWQWISAHLATIPLQPASAADNVRAGVLLLHALLAQTGTDSGAAAGYYQGLASIRRNGEFPSTKQYVQDVLSLEARFGG